MDELFPWDHISTAVRKKYLAEDYLRSQQGLTRDDCREHCYACGILPSFAGLRRLNPGELWQCPEVKSPQAPSTDSRPTGHSLTAHSRQPQVLPEGQPIMIRLRITFAKTPAMRFTGHLDLHRAWERTFRRAGLPLAYSEGFNPHPRLNLASALPLGFTGQGEVIDAWLEQDLPLPEIQAALQRALPPGFQVAQIETGRPAPAGLANCAGSF